MIEFGEQYATLAVSRAGYVTTVTINRPDVLNAINMQMYADIASLFAVLEDDPETRVVLFTGQGRAFSVGADLKERPNMSLVEVKRRRRLAPSVFGSIANCSRPVIAAVNGYAMGGGCELALACDIILASTQAVFSLPETVIGVIPGGGATQRLPRLVGPQVAKEWIFTGRRFSAQEALAQGMILAVHEPECLLDRAHEMGATIAQNAPIAVSQGKKAINAALRMDLETGILFEAEAYQTALHTEDRDEGLRAFREKRRPDFGGK